MFWIRVARTSLALIDYEEFPTCDRFEYGSEVFARERLICRHEDMELEVRVILRHHIVV